MGRPSTGWKLRWTGGRAYVRFTHDRERHEIATGERDPGAAARKAGEIYARTVAGQQRKRRPRRASATIETENVIALWLADLGDTHDPRTVQSYEQYAAHWIARWPMLVSITPRAIDAWRRERLAEVQLRTLRKWTSALRGFLSWCVERRHMIEEPLIPRLPRRTQGTVARPKRAHPDMTDEQAEAVLAALPLVASRHTTAGDLCPVRAYYRVMWETGLREGTMLEIEAPTHYRRGGVDLAIPNEGDKGRFGRTVPLTKAARAALDAVCPDVGRIFPAKPGRGYLRAAAKAAGMTPAAVVSLTPYSLRHNRITNLLEVSGNLLGVGFLVGHKHVSTTDKYLRSKHRHAADVLAKAEHRVSGKSPKTLAKRGKK